MKKNMKTAVQIAKEIQATLAPYCEPGRCLIAGSIRRGKPNPKDIEIVCDPLTVRDVDLLGTPSYSRIRIPAFVKTVKSLGLPEKGQPMTGRYVQILHESGYKIDLFIPQAEDYWRQVAIRTGPANYSGKVIASGWVRKGWVGTHLGLRQRKDCAQTPSGWKVINPAAAKPPVWQNEDDFFKWLGLEWVRPEDRRL